VCDEFWLVAGGSVQPFDGDLDDYQRYLLDLARREREAVRANAAAQRGAAAKAALAPAPSNQPVVAARITADGAPPSSAVKKPSPSTLKRKLQEVEATLEALQAEQTRLQTSLATSTDADQLATLGQRLNTLAQELCPVEEAWLALSEQLHEATVTP
jgi:ATP-binding cassette subfamily F protein 3